MAGDTSGLFVHALLPPQPGAETSSDRCESRPQAGTDRRPAISIIFLSLAALAHCRIVALAATPAPHWSVAPTAWFPRPDERTCSQCKMSARAAGSRPAGVALSIIKRWL